MFRSLYPNNPAVIPDEAVGIVEQEYPPIIEQTRKLINRPAQEWVHELLVRNDPSDVSFLGGAREIIQSLVNGRIREKNQTTRGNYLHNVCGFLCRLRFGDDAYTDNPFGTKLDQGWGLNHYYLVELKSSWNTCNAGGSSDIAFEMKVAANELSKIGKRPVCFRLHLCGPSRKPKWHRVKNKKTHQDYRIIYGPDAWECLSGNPKIRLSMIEVEQSFHLDQSVGRMAFEEILDCCKELGIIKENKIDSRAWLLYQMEL